VKALTLVVGPRLLLSPRCVQFAADRYGSRSKRSRIARHGFIGFMSSRKRHPQVPLVWMST
jgi:hypothetical protein